MQHPFTTYLLNWYAEHKRDLPWRGETDPYRVWISEIILQQTRIAQGWSYYLRFIERFPDITTLAEASQDEVLKYWQGLGYYSRARNLHAAAQYILHQHNAVFPSLYADIIRIKGVGEYTAAAIASICFRLPLPALDGNALRVLSRVFAVTTPVESTKGRKEIRIIAEELIDKENPGTFNQAMMDFGSIECTSGNPACPACCLNTICIAFKEQKQHLFPVKRQKTTLKERFFDYFFLQKNDVTFLRKRAQKDIWQGLYEFPLIESPEQMTENEILHHPRLQEMLAGCQWRIEKITPPSKHQLTHQLIRYRFFVVRIMHGNPVLPDTQTVVALNSLNRYPVAKITETFLKDVIRIS
jgi:A/G-specific adenine glycosylase